MFRRSRWVTGLLLIAAGCEKQQPPGEPQSYEVHFATGGQVSTGGALPVSGGSPGTGGQPATGGARPTGGAHGVGGAVASCEADASVAARSGAPRSARERFDEDNPKIVGGSNSTFNWAVAITTDGKQDTQFCGGTLIDPRWVLTAAHCNVQPGAVIVGGRSDLTNDQGGGTATVTRVLTHSKYRTVQTGDDIALLELKNPISGTSVIRLPASPSSINGKVTAVGWGRLTEGGPSSPKQQMVSVPVVSNEKCSAAYEQNIAEGMLCAGEPGKDSCQGDSGGPIAQKINGHWTQVGIVSWGRGCARRDIYGVYTDLMHYLDWIKACRTDPQ